MEVYYEWISMYSIINILKEMFDGHDEYCFKMACQFIDETASVDTPEVTYTW